MEVRKIPERALRYCTQGESAFIEKNIPIDYVKIFFESIENLELKRRLKCMSKTLNKLYADKTSLQYAIKAIKAREYWLEQITDLFNSQDFKKDECVEIVNNLRMLSIHAVECIQN